MDPSSLPQDLATKFTIICALGKYLGLDTKLIHELTDIPEPTIKRQIGKLRTDFCMEIEYIREMSGSQGKSGAYQISDWGIINKKVFLEHYGSMVKSPGRQLSKTYLEIEGIQPGKSSKGKASRGSNKSANKGGGGQKTAPTAQAASKTSSKKTSPSKKPAISK